MKKILLALIAIAFGLSTAFAQSIQGSWGITFYNEQGEGMKTIITFAEDTYTVDFGADGKAEVEGSYTMEGDEITVMDTGGDPEIMCGDGAKGVYKIAVSDTELTMTKVSDECPGRGGQEGVMTFTRE